MINIKDRIYIDFDGEYGLAIIYKPGFNLYILLGFISITIDFYNKHN